MKKFRTILLVSALLAAFYISATAVFAETTYTWVRCGSSCSGTTENGMLVMHNTINDRHADGEQNYAETYCALQVPPDTFPADKELALKVQLYGNVIRNDGNRGIILTCDVIVAPSGLDRDATLNAGNSMTPDDYTALGWGNYYGFGSKETTVRRYMSKSGYSEGDTVSIYLRTNFGQSEWKYKLVKTGSAGSSTGANPYDKYYLVGKYVYEVVNNKASYFYNKNPNATSISIPATIKYKGKKIPVTGISDLAFNNMKKLKSVTIGKNVKTIGKNAFSGCKNLKKITIKTTKLTAKSIKAKAFTGINKKATIYCPKTKKAAYKKIFLKKGMKKTMKFKASK